jgi:hypothetical protein
MLDLNQKSTTLSGKVKETAKQSKAKQSQKTRRQQQQHLLLSSLSFLVKSFLGPPHFFSFGWRNFGIVAKAKQSKSQVLFCGTVFMLGFF